MLRRSFVSFAAAAASAAPTTGRKVKIAFLGTTHPHGLAKLKLCSTSADWDVTGVWEPEAAAAEKLRASGVRMISRDDALRGDAEVISVESHVRQHGELGIAVLEAGKHLHLEKPASHNLTDLKRMVEFAERKQRLVQMGYMWRYHPGFKTIFEAVNNRWLGEIHQVRGVINTQMGVEGRAPLVEFKGGQMFELGGHLIDPLVRVLGRPEKVTPVLRHDGAINDGLLDNCVTVFEYRRAFATITAGSMQPEATSHRMFEVQGANGTATLRPIEGSPRLEIWLAEAAGPYKKGRNEVTVPRYTRYVDDLAELAECVRSGKTRIGPGFAHELALQETLLRAGAMLPGA